MSPSQIKKFAEKHGVHFETGHTASCWNVECWSPDGMKWKATGTHFYALPGDGYYTKPDWDETMKTLADAVEYGFEKCDDKDCDVCNE